MASLHIKDIRIHRLEVPLKQPFITHLQTVKERESIILEIIDASGMIGYGECVAFSSPWYTEETIETCIDALRKWLLPPLVDQIIHHPEDVVDRLQFVKGNRMAKAAIDGAIWDLFAKKQGKPLWQLIGGVEKTVEAGIVLTGELDEAMIRRVTAAREIGYKRVKLKIDVKTDPLKMKVLVNHFPNLLFYGDANGIFHTLGMERLLAFDEVGLTLIEQPFLEDDWHLHQKATKRMKTPIALDESLRSIADVERMIEQEAGDIIVLKPGRVGGITPALAIHRLAEQARLPIWLGGMIELGISKAQNMALATLPQMSLPGDFSASTHFWEADIISPQIHVKEGLLSLANEAGLGYSLNRRQLSTYTVMKWHMTDRR